MITYRDATPDDASAIATVEVESKRASVPEISSEMQMNHGWSLDRWSGYLAGTRTPQKGLAPRVAYLAYDGDRLVGYAACHHTTKRGIDAELQSIYILHEYQRQGIGSALLARITAWAMATGRTSLLAGFHNDNPYVAFYIKCGGDISEGPVIWRDLPKLQAALVE